MAELADAGDSKSPGLTTLEVRPFLAAVGRGRPLFTDRTRTAELRSSRAVDDFRTARRRIPSAVTRPRVNHLSLARRSVEPERQRKAGAAQEGSSSEKRRWPPRAPTARPGVPRRGAASPSAARRSSISALARRPSRVRPLIRRATLLARPAVSAVVERRGSEEDQDAVLDAAAARHQLRRTVVDALPRDVAL